jgi:hypothetical protein
MELARSEGIKSSVECFGAGEREFLIDLFVDSSIDSKTGGEVHEIS